MWFDGSIPVSGFTKTSAGWVVGGWTAQFDHSASFTKGSNAGNFVGAGNPMAAYPDQVFIDAVPQMQVAVNLKPGPGQFSVNYDTKQIVLGNDPGGKEVRASNLSQAFAIGGRVTLRGFGVRRFATPMPLMGAIYLGGRQFGSSMENLVVDQNATQGISVSADSTVLTNVTVSRNGMTGIHANGADALSVANSVMAQNNAQRFNSAPAAAGIKVTRINGLKIVNNLVQDNVDSSGIWLDESVIHFNISRNNVSGNPQYGILTEASDTGIVVGNRVSGAKYGYTAFDTGNVKVFNNQFDANTTWDVGLSQDERRASGSTKSACPWLVRNVVIANNLFLHQGKSTNTGFQVYALDKATRIPVDKMAVTISGNLFAESSPGVSTRMVAWGAGNNVTTQIFDQPQALAAVKNATWTNALIPTGPASISKSSVAQSVAVALPEDVSSALGLPNGAKQVGP